MTGPGGDRPANFAEAMAARRRAETVLLQRREMQAAAAQQQEAQQQHLSGGGGGGGGAPSPKPLLGRHQPLQPPGSSGVVEVGGGGIGGGMPRSLGALHPLRGVHSTAQGAAAFRSGGSCPAAAVGGVAGQQPRPVPLAVHRRPLPGSAPHRATTGATMGTRPATQAKLDAALAEDKAEEFML